MSGAHDAAMDALKDLLWQLPAEFSAGPPHGPSRPNFRVLKSSNVRKVHQALWDLQEYFGMTEDE